MRGILVAVFVVLGLVIYLALPRSVTPDDEELVRASAHGNLQRIRDLILKGANPNVIAMETWTPLIAAIKNNKIEAIEVLIASGADVERIDPGRNTPLFWAVYWNNLRAVEVLLNAGARPLNLRKGRRKTFCKHLADPERSAIRDLLKVRQPDFDCSEFL